MLRVEDKRRLPTKAAPMQKCTAAYKKETTLIKAVSFADWQKIMLWIKKIEQQGSARGQRPHS